MKATQQLNTNQISQNVDRPWRRARRAVRTVALATVLAAPMIVVSAEVAHARIALNHNDARSVR